jgi:hypothetical protein
MSASYERDFMKFHRAARGNRRQKGAIDEQRKAAREAPADEVRKLRTELRELSAMLSELQWVLAAKNAKVPGLPLLPLTVREEAARHLLDVKTPCRGSGPEPWRWRPEV